MSERISAMMDGELDDAEAAVLIEQLRREPGARAAWDAYHLVGDALRGDLRPALAAAVSERLAGEPTVLAPRGGAGRRVEHVLRYALSAAAGVAGVAFVVWMAAPAIGPGGPAQLARRTPAEPPQIARAPVREPVPQVQSYLYAHGQSAAGLPVTPVGWEPSQASGIAR